MHAGRTGFRRYAIGLGIALALLTPGAAGAQGLTPPINGTVAMDGTVQTEYQGAHLVAVKTRAGAEHVFHFTKNLFVHHSTTNGGKS